MEKELISRFQAFPLEKKIQIGKLAGKIAQLKTRAQWQNAFEQIDKELLPFVRKMAKKVWVSQQKMDRERNGKRDHSE